MTNRIKREPFAGSRIPSPDTISPLLPRFLQPFISTAHPASLLLFDRGLTFQIASWEGRPFLLLDSDGISFLPAPPPWSFPETGRPSSGDLSFPDFWDCLSETLQQWNGGIPGHLDSLPVGLRASGFHAPQKTETEYILHRASWERLQGMEFRNQRWERNRLLREVPDLRTLPWDNAFRFSAKRLIDRFFAFRSGKTDDPYARILLEDQHSAHEKAIEAFRDLGLTGLVLLSGRDVIAITWFALIPEERSAICFLEARNPFLTGISVFFTQEFFRLFPSFQYLNIQGGSGMVGIEQAKKLDSPQACSPIHTQSLSSANRS
ncbi:MAG: hypothetical protein ACYCTV_11260 [Leptospirales bacterium]